MRLVIRLAIGAVLLLALVLGGLALYLPRLLQGPAVRERIQSAAREATGREVTWSALEVGLFPPRLVVESPSLSGATADAPPFAEARRVGLELALAPLLARAVLVDSLVVEGATVRLRRTQDGIEWPRPPEKQRDEAARAERPREERERGFQLAVRELELRDVRLLLEDVSVQPPVTWDLGDVDGSARATSPDEPLEFSLSGTLGSGGSLRGAGHAVLGGPLDAALTLEGVETSPASAYLQEGQKVAGAVSGELRVRGGSERPEAVQAKLVLEQGVFELDEIGMRGRIELEADLAGPDLGGPFKIDATAAELEYGGGIFTKPAGRPATATGKVVPREDGGYDLDEVRVQIQNVDARGRVYGGERLRAELTAPAFEVAGWEELLPAFAGYMLGGRVALRDLVLATAPLEVGGVIALEGLRLASPRSPPLSVDGELEGRGDAIVAGGLALVAAGQALRVDGRVDGLAAGRPRLRLRARGEELDTQALLRAYAGKDALEGPLDLDLDLSVPLAEERPLSQSAAGRARIDVGRGRIRGVSLLRASFDTLGRMAEAAVLANRLRGSDKLERFYEDEFESIGATLAIGDGFARSDDLRLVYRHYTADLRGSVQLADLALDLTGELRVDPALEDTLAGREAAAAPASRRRATVIPLAHVRGTLDAPRVDLSPSEVASLTSRFAVARERSRLQEEIDERLGAGAGEAVTDVLDGILGGSRKKP